MKICPNCGSETEDNNNFCPECGHRLGEVSDSDEVKNSMMINTDNTDVDTSKDLDEIELSLSEKNGDEEALQSIVSDDIDAGQSSEVVNFSESSNKSLDVEMKKKLNTKVLIISLLAVIAIIGIVIALTGSQKSYIASQISEDALATSTVHGLSFKRPKEWKARINDDSEFYTCLKNNKWIAEEALIYEGESSDEAKIDNYNASYTKDAIDRGTLSIDGFNGEYVVSNGIKKQKDKEVTTYVALFKADHSVFSFSYSAAKNDFDVAHAESLLKNIDIKNYSGSESSYTLLYYNEDMVDGMETSQIEGNIDLVRKYEDGTEETIDKKDWYIKSPDKLQYPTSTIIIVYDGEDLEFDFDIAKKGEDSSGDTIASARSLMDSIEQYCDTLIDKNECNSYEEAGDGKYIFISWPSGSRPLVSGVVFQKKDGDNYVEIEDTDEKPDSMTVRTSEVLMEGQSSMYVKGQSVVAMEHALRAILPGAYENDDDLSDQLYEMHEEAAAQITGDGDYGMSTKEINNHEITLLVVRKDDVLDSAFTIKF